MKAEFVSNTVPPRLYTFHQLAQNPGVYSRADDANNSPALISFGEGIVLSYSGGRPCKASVDYWNGLRFMRLPGSVTINFED
jgi:hypothetical protein